MSSRFVTRLCTARVEGADAEALAVAYLAHTHDAHANLKLSERRLKDAADAIRRSGGWDGERAPIADDLEVVPLTPAMKDSYIAYFDDEAFCRQPCVGVVLLPLVSRRYGPARLGGAHRRAESRRSLQNDRARRGERRPRDVRRAHRRLVQRIALDVAGRTAACAGVCG